MIAVSNAGDNASTPSASIRARSLKTEPMVGYWFVGFLFVFAVVLTVYHFEWTGLEDTVTHDGKFDSFPSEERSVLPVYETYRKIGLLDDPNAEIRNVHGIYVRRSRSVIQGVIFGGLLPLVLIGLAGLIAFGKRKASA